MCVSAFVSSITMQTEPKALAPHPRVHLHTKQSAPHPRIHLHTRQSTSLHLRTDQAVHGRIIHPRSGGQVRRHRVLVALCLNERIGLVRVLVSLVHRRPCRLQLPRPAPLYPARVSVYVRAYVRESYAAYPLTFLSPSTP